MQLSISYLHLIHLVSPIYYLLVSGFQDCLNLIDRQLIFYFEFHPKYSYYKISLLQSTISLYYTSKDCAFVSESTALVFKVASYLFNMSSQASTGPKVLPPPVNKIEKIAATKPKKPGQAPNKALPIHGVTGVKFVYSTPLHYSITILSNTDSTLSGPRRLQRRSKRLLAMLRWRTMQFCRLLRKPPACMDPHLRQCR